MAARRSATGSALVHHLTVACSWPRDWAQRLDVIGAYRFYVIEFAPRPDVTLYLQVWSEAGDALLFEVSSGHGYAPTEAYLSEELRESLLGRGFEVGGPAQNYRKKVVIDGELAIRALAREMLAIAVDVFGYDGTSALTFRLHQDFADGPRAGVPSDPAGRLSTTPGAMGNCGEVRADGRAGHPGAKPWPRVHGSVPRAMPTSV